ncbi:DDE-domain-containing protein, partial [Didymella exigua CBS 183.55]
TLNKLGITWLKHFNTRTKDQKVGAHRLLIVDGYESHSSHEFHKHCEEEKIIVLCMPAHSSHLLQPLNVGCFSPLKRAYSDKISGLAQYSSKQIKKEAFLLAFKAAFKRLITKENIYVGFRGAGLVLQNLEAVILKLNVVLCTLTLLKLEDTL